MRQLILKCMKYFIFFLFLVLSVPSCDKINESPIPDVYISFTINLNIYNDLNVPGNAMYFPGAGIGGVIISCFEPGYIMPLMLLAPMRPVVPAWF
jgi:hypothetical protein